MQEYTAETLESTPERVTKFLSGVAAVPIIRTVLGMKGGMTGADIQDGRDLLFAVLAEPFTAAVAADTREALRARQATADLDAWDDDNFDVAKATLDHRYPSVSEYVFEDLTASVGAGSVRAVATFLTRLTTLEAGSDPAREATRDQDREAVAFLANRHIGPDERRELQEKVDLALGPTPPLPDVTAEPDPSARRAALMALRGWFDEWSAIARRVIKKRSHLIRLGLAHRRSPTARAASDAIDEAEARDENE
ncbi:MAG: hypothetical protein ACOY3Y_02515 [Acidobacteriota bacterium]